jgi:ABC-type sulfate transport system permease component
MIPFAVAGIARAVAGIAALFGGALLLKETKETVKVVPDTAKALQGLVLPITIVAIVFVVRAMKGK